MDENSALKSKEANSIKSSIKEYTDNIFNNKSTKTIENNRNVVKPAEKNNIEIKENVENDKNGISNNQKIIKKRNAGIDLIRIVAMIGIVYTHILYQGRGILTYPKYRTRILSSYTYIFWHNNAYALISGIVGYKSTKYSNLLYLWLCVVFFSLIIRFYYLIFRKNAKLEDKLKDFFPAISGSYWYFTAYFVMFLFLPAINKGIQHLSKPEFKLLVMGIYGILISWQTLMNNKEDHFQMNKGISSLWLLCLYIIGAYIGKYNIVYTGIKRYILIVIYLTIFIFLCTLFNKYSYTVVSNTGNNNPILIYIIKKLLPDDINNIYKATLSLSVTLFFLQLKYNEYLSKIISFLGPLTFGVYLIHLNPNVVNNYLSNILNGESRNLTENEVIRMFILKVIKIFVVCIIFEYLRYLLFNILKIREICIFIERIAYKIAS